MLGGTSSTSRPATATGSDWRTAVSQPLAGAQTASTSNSNGSSSSWLQPSTQGPSTTSTSAGLHGHQTPSHTPGMSTVQTSTFNSIQTASLGAGTSRAFGPDPFADLMPTGGQGTTSVGNVNPGLASTRAPAGPVIRGVTGGGPIDDMFNGLSMSGPALGSQQQTSQSGFASSGSVVPPARGNYSANGGKTAAANPLMDLL